MRLVTFVPKKGAAPRVGVLHGGNHVLDAAQAARNAPFDPHDMLSLIAAGSKGLAWVKKVAAQARNPVPLGKVKLLAPIPRPRKNVFCVGWNYVEYEALGQDFRTRGAREEEQIQLLRRLFTEPVVDFAGRFDRVDRAADGDDVAIDLAIDPHRSADRHHVAHDLAVDADGTADGHHVVGHLVGGDGDAARQTHPGTGADLGGGGHTGERRNLRGGLLLRSGFVVVRGGVIAGTGRLRRLGGILALGDLGRRRRRRGGGRCWRWGRCRR